MRNIFMRFILGFKGVFIILYCINLFMIYYIFYQKVELIRGLCLELCQ